MSTNTNTVKRSKKVSLNDAISAISSNSENTLIKTDKKKKTTKKEVIVEEDIVIDESKFNETFEVKKKDTKLKYSKTELHAHILKRPEIYIGDPNNKESETPLYVLDKPFEEGLKIKAKTIIYPEVLIRMFVETVSNAIDNTLRSLEEGITPKFIKINIDKETGKVSVWNDGKNIPLDMHEEEKIPIPELIFGNLLTSSNYDDDEARKTSGKNGLGEKLVNVFSKEFTVEIYNKEAEKIYYQTWRDNMYKKDKPTYKTKGFPKTLEDGKNGYTLIEFIPDFSRFKINGFNNDIIAYYEKIVLDTAMSASIRGVKTYYNGKLVPINNIKDYVNLYFDEPQKEMICLSSKDSRVVLCTSDDSSHVSFVNGICTNNGGVHVKKWSDTVFKPIADKINDSLKNKGHIDASHVKKHFFMFVYSEVANPEFDSQNKNKLMKPLVEAKIEENEVKKMCRWSFVEKIKESLKSKELTKLKTETERKRGTVNVDGLDDANFAGKKGKSQECILCLTEGDSANTYAIAGMKYGVKINGKEYKGHDYIGSLPIKGKFLNVRNASVQQLIKNEEVKSLIQSIGLQYDTDYSNDENFKKLRYGRIMAITDADVDGHHITGLLFNFIHTLFPTLAKRKGFFNYMKIPLVKIGGKHNKSFFSQHTAEEYIEKYNPKKDDIKYFKGLGTAQDQDIEEDFGRRLVEFEVDEKGDYLMQRIFGKEHADFRKEWIMNYKHVPMDEGKDYIVQDMNITDFLNHQMILFSIDDCKRSIPHVLDGLKESQRKIVYSAFKRRLYYNDKSMKVAQFAGYVAEHSNYHHGEQNLIDTVVKLAQTFVGSNNIPLFFNEGQFGSRVQNGSDAASGRYLFTKLNMPTRYLFRQEDDEFLKDRVEEGDEIEKEFYVPIVPMILVNGCSAGIGSGFSSSIPSYKLDDIIKEIKLWLTDKNAFNESDQIIPWIRGFKGTVELEDKKVITKGCYEKVKDGVYRITEIPIGKNNISINKYKEFLINLVEEKKIVSYTNNSTESIVDFTIKSSEDFEINHKSLNLIDTMYTSNMILFDPNEKIKKYDTVKNIIDEFCTIRYELYKVRKEGILSNMKEELLYLQNKIRFISDIRNEKITLKDRDDESLNNEMEERKYNQKDNSYDYLLNIPIKSMTTQRLEDLQVKEKNLLKQIESYEKKTINQIWIEEIEELIKECKKWEQFEDGRKLGGKKTKKVSK